MADVRFPRTFLARHAAMRLPAPGRTTPTAELSRHWRESSDDHFSQAGSASGDRARYLGRVAVA
jgi:hypothetical protein